MASTPEIQSLPRSQTHDLSSHWVSVLNLPELQAVSLRFREMQEKCWDMVEAMEMRPNKLPELFFMRQPAAAMEAWKTDGGTWSPKKLVSIPNTSQGNSPNSPKFVGAKTTLEFKPTDGTKAVHGMTRYNLLTTREDGDGLYLDEELSLCHVFPLEGKGKGTRSRNGKRSRSGNEFDPRNGFTPAEVEELERIGSEIDPTEYPPLAVDDGSVNVQDLLFADPSKSEPSKIWQGFTKIHTKNPKLMYAACNHCDTMLKLKGGSSCGTGSLRHHNDSCRCKPKQEQLPGNSSSMPIPSIALQAVME